ncbi:DUF1566 domain-containing protein [Hydrocarboniclastica marina]|uniref:DUF1566 domain-containing protein n=1 Tax=Hydrocarboniclastica marina TaxID=2259620 RepID=A0A4P7XM89_9ALTE|nr:DUF1566 domain-containing protein [Hydrocarboniclastica marina]
MIYRSFLACAVTLCLSSTVYAQVCKYDSIQPTAKTERYVVHGDATVTDAETGLMWSMCSMGQTYNEGACSGSAKSLSWEQALQEARVLNNAGGIAGHSNWRLPNIKELGSLVEYQCHSPAINLAAFPDTPSATYWSSTPDSRSGKKARSIYFVDGSDLTPDVSSGRFVRLVRDR